MKKKKKAEALPLLLSIPKFCFLLGFEDIQHFREQVLPELKARGYIHPTHTHLCPTNNRMYIHRDAVDFYLQQTRLGGAR